MASNESKKKMNNNLMEHVLNNNTSVSFKKRE